MAVIAAARAYGLADANTTEVDPDTANPVIATRPIKKAKKVPAARCALVITTANFCLAAIKRRGQARTESDSVGGAP